MVTIHGKVPSKSNLYRIIHVGGKTRLGKSDALRKYEDSFFLQVPGSLRGKNITDLVEFEIHVYYPSNRSDLDNSLKVVLDCLQVAGVIKNDNRVVKITAHKHLDKVNPRVEFLLKTIKNDEN